MFTPILYNIKGWVERMFPRRNRSPDVLKVGDSVVLFTPDNPRLHNKEARVESLQEWGANVMTIAAGTGRYRALYSEMIYDNRIAAPPDSGYTGDVCPTCQGSRMRRCGTCAICEDCGSTSGCS